MKTLCLIIAAFVLVFGAAVSRADVMRDLKKTNVDLNTQAQTNAGRTRVLTAISTETGIPINTLRAEQSASGLGFGDLLIANLLATESGKTFNQIVTMFKAGEGWGKIAHDLGLNLGQIVSKARQADQAALQGQNAQRNNATGLDRSQLGPGNNFGNGFGPGPGQMPSQTQGMGHGRP